MTQYKVVTQDTPEDLSRHTFKIGDVVEKMEGVSPQLKAFKDFAEYMGVSALVADAATYRNVETGETQILDPLDVEEIVEAK